MKYLMKLRTVLTIGLLTLLASNFAFADIVRSQLTSAIEAREPTNDLLSDVVGQPGEVTTVFYFNHLTNMADSTLTHKWYLNGEEKAVIELPIGSNNWRTYSSKRMNSVMQGEWQIQVWMGDQHLQTHEFTFSIAD